MIKVGDRLPEGTAHRIHRNRSRRLPAGPNSFKRLESIKGKKIAIFGAARRLHPDLLGQACAELRRQLRQAQGQGRG